jgi:putative membrane protein
LVLLAALIVSAFHPYNRTTWLMEVLPVLIALPILVLTYRRFPLTPLLYVLIFCHALVLIVGGFYTYARVPLGFWIKDLFSLARNDYDKLGHFFQGLVPMLLAREILLRRGFVRSRRMAAFLSICVALAISAGYEMIEWASALAMGQGASQFLGTQGDPWDTQSDMFSALVGAVCALIFARWQDSQIAAVESAPVHAVSVQP